MRHRNHAGIKFNTITLTGDKTAIYSFQHLGVYKMLKKDKVDKDEVN